jgi:hypothetical protein
MKKKLLSIVLLLTGLNVFGQINTGDSTVQVVSYWNKGEKQSYSITLEKSKVQGVDTTSKEVITYNVEVTVKDSTDKSYTIEWLYKDFTTNSTNETVKKLMNITKDMKVIFRTNEFGAFVEVINWKEIRDYILNTSATLQKDFANIPGIDRIIQQLIATYSTKEAIESASIKDIRQFHTFHGGKYKLGEEVEGVIKVANMAGPEPFDAAIKVYLDEINTEENSFILKSAQEINKEQLADATFSYMTTLAKNMNVALPKREDVKNLRNETWTASKVYESGWVVYSVQTTTVMSGNMKNIEERTIELQ